MTQLSAGHWTQLSPFLFDKLNRFSCLQLTDSELRWNTENKRLDLNIRLTFPWRSVLSSITAQVRVWTLSERERETGQRETDRTNTHRETERDRYLPWSDSVGYTVCISWRNERGLSLSPEFLPSEQTVSETSWRNIYSFNSLWIKNSQDRTHETVKRPPPLLHQRDAQNKQTAWGCGLR